MRCLIPRKCLFITTVLTLAVAADPVAWSGDIVLHLEEPVALSTYAGVANVRGWAVGSAGISRVELYVDNQFETNIPVGGLRPDVGSSYPSYPNSANAGYSMAYNYSELAAGQHTILVRVIDADGAHQEATATFDVARFDNPYIADPTSISLNGATVSSSGSSIFIYNMTADGKTYDVRLDWQTPAQNFMLVQIVPTGGTPPPPPPPPPPPES